MKYISSHVSHTSFDCNILIIVPPFPSVSYHGYTDRFSSCFVVLATQQVIKTAPILFLKECISFGEFAKEIK